MHSFSTTAIVIALGFFATAGLASQSDSHDDSLATIMSMERSALDRWAKGDPDGFLDISDPDVVYFDPFISQRINGIDALRKWYEGVRGKIHINHYELVEPKLALSGEMALLTFNFTSHGSEGAMRWNTTEVYRRRHGQWRIIHSHWSLTEPKLVTK